MEGKRFQQAKETYEKILQKEPNHYLALNNLAWLLATSKDPGSFSARQSPGSGQEGGGLETRSYDPGYPGRSLSGQRSPGYGPPGRPAGAGRRTRPNRAWLTRPRKSGLYKRWIGGVMLDAGYWILDTGCWILDAGYLMLILDTGCWIKIKQQMLDQIADTEYWIALYPESSIAFCFYPVSSSLHPASSRPEAVNLVLVF